jgi:ribonuclease E
MSDETPTPTESPSTGEAQEPTAKKTAAKRAAPRKSAAKTPAKKATTRTTAKKATVKKAAADLAPDAAPEPTADETPTKKTAAKKTAAKKTAAKKATVKKTAAKKATAPVVESAPADPAASAPGVAPLFQAPDPSKAPAKRTAKKATAKNLEAPEAPEASGGESGEASEGREAEQARPAKRTAAKKAAATPESGEAQPEQRGEQADTEGSADDADSGDEGANRRRRRRGGRRRRKSSGEGGGDSGQDAGSQDGRGTDEAGHQDTDDRDDGRQDKSDSGKQGSGGRGGQKGGRQNAAKDSDPDEGGDAGSRRRRRRRRAGEEDGGAEDDPRNTVTRVRKSKSPEDQITALAGSTRLEAKKQRRREGREAGRRRAPIVSEAEFLARRESVERVMAIRQRDDLTQIAVLEDKVLVEHYVARESQTSLIGNVYLGRVQNVLPSMEAAFIDIGKGRNAVLYAGEVNWQLLGHKDGQPRKIESVLSSGQSVLVQVTKDPIGHKGARLTSQISLAGRFLVYVPDGNTSGISRKLPDTERTRLKSLLKEIVPDSAGVIVRTAAEGATEEELTRDVERLKARWEDIEKKSKGQGPKLLYGEPDLTLKVVRDLFTEDFANLVVQGADAWDTVREYVDHVAPDLIERLERYEPSDHGGADVFAAYRIDEQIHKGLDRKVWLPSGGSLIIDRTEAMTVVDVNTGKFTGSGGNLEETVTKNNLEAAEEMVRQLRLRDIGGIIVIDFIDMVLESNRDLVLRRLVECLGRDRTRHQVAEVTSLGLVQMTRKRIGTGLLEAFSETCPHCGGRGVVTHDMPVETGNNDDDSRRSNRRSRGNRKDGDSGAQNPASQSQQNADKTPSPKDVANMPRHEPPADEAGGQPESTPVATEAPESPQAPTTAETSAPKTSTRSRSRTKVKADQDAGTDAAVEAPVPTEEPSVPAPETAAEPEPEPETAAQTAPPAPVATTTVVTRTRRRSASRPAGPPTASVPPMTPAGEQSPDQPTSAVGRVGEPPADGIVEPGTSGTEPGAAGDRGEQAPAIAHVPVKKKGSRKR